MKAAPFALGVALSALLAAGMSQAALMDGVPSLAGGLSTQAFSSQKLPTTETKNLPQLAGMLLMDDAMLADPSADSASGNAESVDSEVEVQQVRQQTRPNSGNTQEANIGKKTRSSTSGQVRTRGVVSTLNQQQSGRHNQQTMDVGSVTNSHTSGSIKLDSHISHGSQQQSGISNNQGMNFGSVR